MNEENIQKFVILISNYLSMIKSKLCVNCKNKMDQPNSTPANSIQMGPDRMILPPSPDHSSLNHISPNFDFQNFDMNKTSLNESMKKKLDDDHFVFDLSPRKELTSGPARSELEFPLRKDSDYTLFGRKDYPDSVLASPLDVEEKEEKKDH